MGLDYFLFQRVLGFERIVPIYSASMVSASGIHFPRIIFWTPDNYMPRGLRLAF
jgi:hypothetical protein